ncbi:MAG: pitrilysin family protein [Burkholderiaceae bacterium]|jgi:zinc protease
MISKPPPYLLSFLLAVVAALAPGLAAAQLPSPVTTVEGVTEYDLPNGLRVLLAPDASKPTTTVSVLYLVGSRMESYGETGMAHLLEHLMFKGTPSFANGALVKEFTARGMEFNANTYFDRTHYFETFTASPENLDWALKMEADRMVNSFIARKDLDSEMTVVRNEMESGENSPGRMLRQKVASAAYQWHSYGHNTIGARSDVENVNIPHLQAFYHKYYQPDNAVLTVAGSFDVNATLARIVATLGAIPKPTRALEPTYTVEPPQDGPREVTLERVGETPIVGAAYHIPAGSHPDFAAIEILASILGDPPAGRLYKSLVASHQAAGVEVEPVSLKEPGLFEVFARLDKDQSLATAQATLLMGLEKDPTTTPFTPEEVDRAKVKQKNDYDKIADDPVELVANLAEASALGDWRLFFIERDRVAKVTPADVVRVAQTYLKATNRTLGIFIPTPKPDAVAIPATPNVGTLVADYHGNAAKEAGETWDPDPLAIEKRVDRTVLANGLQLALLPKKTKGASVSGTITLRMGDAKSLFDKKMVSQLTASMLTRGTTTLSRQQISDRLDALDSKLSVSGVGGSVSVSFQTRREKLQALLDLVRDLLRNPAFPESEFATLKIETAQGINASRSEPQPIAVQAFRRYDNPYPKGDLRYRETFDESLAAVNAAQIAELKSFHDRFYGASHAQVAIVGDFDPAPTKSSIASLFGDWSNSEPYARVESEFRYRPAHREVLATPGKANAFFIGGVNIPIRDDDPAYQALDAGNDILGGSSLKSRLADRLRQKDGLSYGSGSQLQGSSHTPNSMELVFAIFAPQNQPKVESDVKEEVARLLKDGVTQQELDDAKSGILQSRAIARSDDGELAGLLSSQLELDRTLNFSAEQDARLKAVTVDDVNAVLRRYIDPDHVVQIYAGDFK